MLITSNHDEELWMSIFDNEDVMTDKKYPNGKIAFLITQPIIFLNTTMNYDLRLAASRKSI